MIEILAPAGSFETLVAAVRCGANAVYLGTKAFNARQNATNFSLEELKNAVDYAHKRGVKIYITLNTLVSDSELESAGDEIINCINCGADAFIVQDLGIASLVKEICPEMPIHASTQMSVQTVEGIEELKKMGFSRIVLPRELSENEIKNISRHCDIELECFVHGALCMCISGQCLMSSMLGGRSGNRGLCAQPCRLEFYVNKKGEHNLSLKDLSLIHKIPELAKSGITSLKIEGRMKRPEYVAAAVTACKSMIETGEIKENIMKNLTDVFSRSGFTHGYFTDNLGKEMFGIRTKENVQSSAKVLDELSLLYHRENPLLPIEMDFSLTQKGGELTVKYDKFIAKSVLESPVQKAISKEITRQEATQRLSKLGGTQFYSNKINCQIEKGLFLSAGELNALRRDALSKLETLIAQREICNINEVEFNKNSHKAQDRKLFAQFFDYNNIPENTENIARLILPIDTPKEIIEKYSAITQVALWIPPNVFSNSEKYVEKIREAKNHGLALVVASTLDGVGIAKKGESPFACGFGMNIFNSISAQYIEKIGATDFLCSSEMTAVEIKNLGGEIPRGTLVYGRLPLMVTRNCPVKNEITCKECNNNSALTDRKGISFPVRCKEGCSFIFNSVPLSLLDKTDEITNVDYDLLYFTAENSQEVEEVLKAYKNKTNPVKDFTRGGFFRKVI